MATAAPNYRDYSLTGPEGKLAIKKGLASAEWFVPHVERKTLRRLMQVSAQHTVPQSAIFGRLGSPLEPLFRTTIF